MLCGGKAESLSEIDYSAIRAIDAESKYMTITDASKTSFSVPLSTVSCVADGKEYAVTAPVGNPDTEAAVLALRRLIRSKK